MIVRKKSYKYISVVVQLFTMTVSRALLYHTTHCHHNNNIMMTSSSWSALALLPNHLFVNIISSQRTRFSSLATRRIQAFLEGSFTSPPGEAADPAAIQTIFSRSQIHRMKIADLKLELERRNLDPFGTRKELIPRLMDTLLLVDKKLVSGSTATTTTTVQTREPKYLVDSNRSYLLQVKGLSNLSSNGTGVGFILIDKEDPSTSWSGRKYLQGNRSVFEAEYSALVLAMRYALRRGCTDVTVQIDHDVIQQQLSGVFPVEKESLKGIYWNFMSCREGLESFSIDLVSFLDNHRAIDLAKKALATGKSLHVDDSYDPMAEQFRKKLQNNATPLTNDHGEQRVDPTVTYKLQFDGGARSNPTGVAGAGMVLFDDNGNEIWCGWKYLNKMSNNCAEYWALLLGLQCANSLGVRKLICQGDSELIIKQVTGKYRVKDSKLQALYEPTKEVMKRFDKISFEHIYRNENERADWLANHAMDTKTNHGFDEIDE